MAFMKQVLPSNQRVVCFAVQISNSDLVDAARLLCSLWHAACVTQACLHVLGMHALCKPFCRGIPEEQEKLNFHNIRSTPYK
jgi:hypothetical protein